MRRAKWGVGAVVVVGLAWLVSNFFNMGGLGTGEGTRLGLPVRSTVPTDPDVSRPDLPPQDEPEPPETATVGTEGERRSVGEGGVVAVLIDDRGFFVRRGTIEDGDWVSAEPDVVAGYARQATGDEAGIRVRVFRKPSAKASAEQQLDDVLREAGLKGEEIEQVEKLVE